MTKIYNIISALLIINILIACNSPIKEIIDPFTKASIEHLLIDSSLNIRAIEIFEDSVFAATSDSRLVRMDLNGMGINSSAIDSSRNPNFRSLAVNESGIFTLSIANPALLYKDGILVYNEEHEKVFYDAISFWNRSEGIAMGDPVDSCISIIITMDSGENWTKIPCSQIPVAKDGEAAFAASDTNIKTLGNNVWIATGGGGSRIFYSKDKGVSWQVFDTPASQETATSGLYSIDFYDENIGFGVGGDFTKPENNQKNKVFTLDGGRTWEAVGDENSPGYRSCVQFVPRSKGQALVIVGFKGIDYSHDLGKSWIHLSDEAYYTIRFIDSETAIIAGQNRISKISFE